MSWVLSSSASVSASALYFDAMSTDLSWAPPLEAPLAQKSLEQPNSRSRHILIQMHHVIVFQMQMQNVIVIVNSVFVCARGVLFVASPGHPEATGWTCSTGGALSSLCATQGYNLSLHDFPSPQTHVQEKCTSVLCKNHTSTPMTDLTVSDHLARFSVVPSLPALAQLTAMDPTDPTDKGYAFISLCAHTLDKAVATMTPEKLMQARVESIVGAVHNRAALAQVALTEDFETRIDTSTCASASDSKLPKPPTAVETHAQAVRDDLLQSLVEVKNKVLDDTLRALNRVRQLQHCHFHGSTTKKVNTMLSAIEAQRPEDKRPADLLLLFLRVFSYDAPTGVKACFLVDDLHKAITENTLHTVLPPTVPQEVREFLTSPVGKEAVEIWFTTYDVFRKQVYPSEGAQAEFLLRLHQDDDWLDPAAAPGLQADFSMLVQDASRTGRSHGGRRAAPGSEDKESLFSQGLGWVKTNLPTWGLMWKLLLVLMTMVLLRCWTASTASATCLESIVNNGSFYTTEGGATNTAVYLPTGYGGPGLVDVAFETVTGGVSKEDLIGKWKTNAVSQFAFGTYFGGFLETFKLGSATSIMPTIITVLLSFGKFFFNKLAPSNLNPSTIQMMHILMMVVSMGLMFYNLWTMFSPSIAATPGLGIPSAAVQHYSTLKDVPDIFLENVGNVANLTMHAGQPLAKITEKDHAELFAILHNKLLSPEEVVKFVRDHLVEKFEPIAFAGDGETSWLKTVVTSAATAVISIPSAVYQGYQLLGTQLTQVSEGGNALLKLGTDFLAADLHNKVGVGAMFTAALAGYIDSSSKSQLLPHDLVKIPLGMVKPARAYNTRIRPLIQAATDAMALGNAATAVYALQDLSWAARVPTPLFGMLGNSGVLAVGVPALVGLATLQLSNMVSDMKGRLGFHPSTTRADHASDLTPDLAPSKRNRVVYALTNLAIMASCASLVTGMVQDIFANQGDVAGGAHICGMSVQKVVEDNVAATTLSYFFHFINSRGRVI